MKRWGLIIDNLGQGGAQKQLLIIAKELIKKGDKVDLFYYDSNEFFKKDFENICGNIIKLSSKSHLSRILELKKITKKNKYEYLLSFLLVPSIYSGIINLFSNNLKSIASFRSSHKILTNIKSKLLFKLSLKLCDAMIVNSLENYNFFNKKYKNPKIHLFYNQIESHFYKAPTNEISKPIKLVIIANYRNIKNGVALIQALKKLTTHERSQFKIDWYGNDTGDGSYYLMNELKKKYDLKELSLNSGTKNIIEVIDDSDCIGLFSKSEGFPNTICEGASRGKILLSSKVSGIEILFKHQNKLFFDPTNTEEIKKSFKQLMKLSHSKRFDIQQNNYRIAKENFQDTYLPRLKNLV